MFVFALGASNSNTLTSELPPAFGQTNINIEYQRSSTPIIMFWSFYFLKYLIVEIKTIKEVIFSELCVLSHFAVKYSTGILTL